MAGRLEGLVGLHGYAEDFDASRLIVPPPTEQRVGSAFHTQNLGLYTLQKLRLTDRWQLQLGGRWETQEIKDDSLAGLVPPTVLEQESLSGALGLTWSREQWAGMKKFSLTGILSSTERIPTATERYSFWNNAGLGRFLVGGDLDGRPLGLEKSLGFELGLSAEWERASLKLNGFRYDYENFIFLQELPNFIQRAVQYIEREAVIQGFEGQLDCRLWQEGTRRLQLSLLGDYVHGQNTTDDEPLPRIPPLRIGARLEFTTGALTFGLEARHSFAQNLLKPEPRGELPTGDFTLVNADASWRFLRGRHDVMLTFQLTNLLDQDARQHTSFRKDVAPLPGLGASASLRWSF
jgi:iron complex outermembrane receptor protein